jgi:uncharacterized membrane protein
MTSVALSVSGKSFKLIEPLEFSTKLWFVVATAGIWAFGTYTILFYHVSAFAGDFEKWKTVLPKSHVAPGLKGNLIIAAHVLPAAIILIGGPLQLMPFIRRKFKTFHRWLGRVYITTAIIVAVAGLTLLWTKGTIGSLDMHIFNSIQAVYIISFAIIAIHFARKRNFVKHRMWALRLFMVSNGVWFFRIGYHAWRVIFGKPVGFDPNTFTGPFPSLLSLFLYAIPVSLIMLEMYFAAQKSHNRNFRSFTATLIFLFTIIMILGIYRGIIKSWLPRL